MYNEVHSLHGHTLLLITKPSLQATALLQHLKQSLSLNGKLHNIQRSFDDIAPGSIILFDMMEADKKLIHYWQDNLSRKNNNIRVLLLNTPDEYPFRDIESWPHINGVFYVTEEEGRVVKVCRAYCAESVISRKSWPATSSRTPVTTAITVRNPRCSRTVKKRS